MRRRMRHPPWSMPALTEGRTHMVIQIVSVSIRPDQRNAWLELVRTATAHARTEEGCESCRASQDVDTPNDYVLVELWTSMEAQYQHFRNPEFGELMGRLDDVLAGPPDVSIHEVASTQTLDEALAAAGAGG
jgi:quinol monooxygenase YgiN